MDCNSMKRNCRRRTIGGKSLFIALILFVSTEKKSKFLHKEVFFNNMVFS
ncbi:hypothetical protein HanHA300_Chr05g0171311 [Helianthus annuus]|nr:hypothetical protein HanHA300_Chr05g0171311 [Helianthus annuus]KAJ0584182.1 hypothetical protein HanHA89_Chr05g0185571 [Helianthus annuus]KAJ0749851.1 hypothetical protein HanLR1_Chr05g0174971 [Helianthus annuus]